MSGRIREVTRKSKRAMNYLLLKLGIKDAYFYLYIWSFILRNKDSEEWKEFSLRHDWIGRIYTVRSYRSEDPNLPEEARYAYVLEQIRPLVDYLTSKNLSEIVMPEIEKIEGTSSYLIKFSPLFYEIGFWWAIKVAAVVFVSYKIFPAVKNMLF